MKFYNTNLDEQETIINIDYFNRKINIYSSRKQVIQRLIVKLGEPNKINYINKSISGANWTINFEDKKIINIALSRPLLIGNMK